VPGLAVVLVGENPASQVYVRNKSERTTAAGMRSIEHRLDRDTDEASLLALIETLNQDDMVDGILVQLPLPNQINADAVINAIRPDKDVDGFHVVNAGLLATGQESLVPCTPFGCLLLLRDQLGDLSGLHAIVVGRSNIVGKPMAQLLLGESCTVTIAHSRTKDLESLCQQADILVAAVGRPEMITDAHVKKGATVIDVGINRVPAPERGDGKFRLTGDVDFDAAAKQAGAITPVPGGVGPMTIACLLRNTLVAASRRHGVTIGKI
jgi:methylenetetrahydrofolate dehydrogenase (NADP+) / methenyltetrahydrofolate cyclohydrolase